MANSAREQQNLTSKNTLSVGRFVYDVMVYTLPKFGLPKTMLPTTDSGENVYNRANSVRIVGALTLGKALIMRDVWKPMFISRRRSSGFNQKEVLKLFGQLQLCCPLCRDRTIQSVMEVFLALCNEMILFCLYENIDIYPITFIKLTTSCILFTIGSNQNFSKVIEELSIPFDDIWKYTKWITNFIREFAIPYGSRDDVSSRFAVKFLNRVEGTIEESSCSEAPSIEEVKDRLGFLPHDVFSAMVVEGSKVLPENLALASWSTLPGNRQSPEPPELPESSKRGTVRGRKWRKRL